MPSAPPIITTAPGAGSPGTPPAAHAAPGAGSPATPPVISAPPSASVAAAALLINPSGTDNSFTLTAVETGAGGNNISGQIASSAASHLTAVAVSGNAITVTPGTKARMTVSGTTPAVAATLLWAADYAGVSGGQLYTSDGVNNYGGGANRTALYRDATTWYLWHWDDSNNMDYTATKVSSNTTPEGLTSWTVTLGSGSPTIAAAVSSAAQCISAVNADASAADLVLAAASGTVTGAVASVAAAFLTGGVGPSTPPVVTDP